MINFANMTAYVNRLTDLVAMLKDKKCDMPDVLDVIRNRIIRNRIVCEQVVDERILQPRNLLTRQTDEFATD